VSADTGGPAHQEALRCADSTPVPACLPHCPLPAFSFHPDPWSYPLPLPPQATCRTGCSPSSPSTAATLLASTTRA
jgi:hypothetical protein